MSEKKVGETTIKELYELSNSFEEKIEELDKDAKNLFEKVSDSIEWICIESLKDKIDDDTVNKITSNIILADKILKLTGGL